MYTVEYLKLGADEAEAVVVDRINGRFPTVEEAKGHGMVLFSTMESRFGAAGFRVMEDGEREVETVFPRTPAP
jgi:hypothetical protein